MEEMNEVKKKGKSLKKKDDYLGRPYDIGILKIIKKMAVNF